MSDKFKEIYQKSINKPEQFWKDASEDIFWFKKPTKILNKSNPPFYKWYEDGITNTCYNALDVHVTCLYVAYLLWSWQNIAPLAAHVSLSLIHI